MRYEIRDSLPLTLGPRWARPYEEAEFEKEWKARREKLEANARRIWKWVDDDRTTKSDEEFFDDIPF